MSRGVLFSIIGSVLFAVLYFYSTLLAPMDGEQIFGWRTLLTFPCLTAFIWWSGKQQLVIGLAQRMCRDPRIIIGAVATSAFLGLQLWLFMWAPLHGRALHVSLGYFLLPLTMLLTGRLLYRERLSRLQNVAAAALQSASPTLSSRSAACRGKRWRSRSAIRSISSSAAAWAPTIWAACGSTWRYCCRPACTSS